MPLWTDVIDPATLTGYVRAALADYEQSKGTLARWLPNREVPDVVARFVQGQTGLVDVANFRAYDAEPEVGALPGGKRVTIELPALGQTIPVSEYNQLRARGNVSEDQALATVQRAGVIAARAASDAMERMRGIVIATGKATISQANFNTDDDFGRPGSNTVTLTGTALWSAGTSTKMANLTTWGDIYRDGTGEDPGTMLMSTRVFRALASDPALQTNLVGGGTRPATAQQVRDYIQGAGFADIVLYDRRVKVNGTAVKVLPDDSIFLLPTAVDPNDFNGTDLGATFWGQTLTSSVPAWGLAGTEQPGIVAGVFRGEEPPMIAKVISDAIGLPVLANAEKSFAAKVL